MNIYWTIQDKNGRCHGHWVNYTNAIELVELHNMLNCDDQWCLVQCYGI